MQYRVSNYFTWHGRQKSILLPDQSYGQWIIYEKLLPKYHVNCFDTNSDSNIKIKELLSDKKQSIEKILERINKMNNTKLSLSSKPLFSVFLNSRLENLELKALPYPMVSKI